MYKYTRIHIHVYTYTYIYIYIYIYIYNIISRFHYFRYPSFDHYPAKWNTYMYNTPMVTANRYILLRSDKILFYYRFEHLIHTSACV